MSGGSRVALVTLALWTAAVGLRAEGAAPPGAPVPPPSDGARAAASTNGDKDVFDVLRDVFGKAPPDLSLDSDKLMIAAAPIVGYGPATGVSFGAAGNIAFYRGPPVSTQISSLVASATVTSKNQVLFNAKVDASSSDNAWNVVGDNRLYWTSQDTYGLGAGTAADDVVGMEFDYFKAHEIVYRKVRGPLFLGGGFLYGSHQNVSSGDEPTAAETPYVQYSTARGFDLETQTSAGASLHVLLNSRDSPINASRGWYASAAYQMFFKDFLGGTSSWQQLNADLRTYVPLSSDARHKLAFWGFGNFVTGGEAPYLDLPATGWDTYGRSGRGYGQGRFRGKQMAYGEVEYRWTLTRNKLLGLVAFVNTETLSDPDTDERLFDSFASAAGAGLRLLINKQSKTNLAVDFGWGEGGEHAVYLAVQEAF